MPPSKEATPAMFLEVPQRFGLRGGATYPVRVQSAPTLTAAAWAQHQLIQALRVWITEAGYASPNAWMKSARLSRNIWGKIMRGEQWVNLGHLALLASHFEDQAKRHVASLASTLSGTNLPQPPVEALPRRAPQRSSAAALRERARNGLAKSGEMSAVDSVWMALEDLAQRKGVSPPKSLLVYEGVTAGLRGTPGGQVSVTLPDPAGPPLPVINGYCVLEERSIPADFIAIIGFEDQAPDGQEFADVGALITADGSLILDDPGIAEP